MGSVHDNNEVIYFNLKEDGFKSIQHKGRLDIHNQWNDIENEVLQAVLNNDMSDERVYKRKIVKKIDDEKIINPSGFQEVDDSKELVQLKDLFDFENGELQSTKNDIDGNYRFITASNEVKYHSTYTNDGEALIYAISAGGSLGKSQYFNGKFIASNLCLILTPKKNSKYKINLQFYNLFLNSIKEKIVDDLADGTSKLTIKKDELKDYYIEYFDIDIQNEFVSKHLIKQNKLLDELDKLNNQIDNELSNLLNS